MSKIKKTTFVEYTEKAGYWEASYLDGNPRINTPMAKTIVKERREYFKNNNIKLLLYGESILKFTINALKYLGGAEGSKGLSAVAIIYKSKTFAGIMRFLTRISKGLIPVEIFHLSEKAEAISFLKEQPSEAPAMVEGALAEF